VERKKSDLKRVKSKGKILAVPLPYAAKAEGLFM
jgi:hypothetical protein